MLRDWPDWIEMINNESMDITVFDDKKLHVSKSFSTPSCLFVVSIVKCGHNYIHLERHCAKLHTTVVLHSVRTIATMNAHGYITKLDKVIDSHTLFKQIRNKYDFVKNPHNVNYHHLFSSDMEPLYESDRMYVTKNGGLYLRKKSEWMLVEDANTWIVSNSDTVDSKYKEEILHGMLLCSLTK